ncbi:MAG: hypothetical protein EOM26_05295 [Alphaproteobacteria bacterium]|nr:hypothetical protein [Alphaproteobacteria bacterium]
MTRAARNIAFFAFLALYFVVSPGSASASRENWGALGAKADYILVEKAKRRMTLYSDGRILRRYKVALGKGGLEPKVKEGDARTPEGVYYISGRNPNSAYHLSLKISYPDIDDEHRARMMGVSPGSNIMIHGLENGITKDELSRLPKDWTLGCIAVTNEEVREIWQLVPDGTPIAIRP